LAGAVEEENSNDSNTDQIWRNAFAKANIEQRTFILHFQETSHLRASHILSKASIKMLRFWIGVGTCTLGLAMAFIAVKTLAKAWLYF
jgi:hypothetical protein